jgi:hypothetical protein
MTILSTDNLVRTYDTRPPFAVQVSEHALPETCLCCTRYGDYLFLGSLEGHVYVLHEESGALTRMTALDDPSPIRSISVTRSASGVFAHAVLGCQDGTVRTVRCAAQSVVGAVPCSSAFRRQAHRGFPVVGLDAHEHVCATIAEDGGLCVGSTWGDDADADDDAAWFRTTFGGAHLVQLNHRFVAVAAGRRVHLLDFAAGASAAFK